ncbi:hypothetical protein CASFOL_018979 [Castilleja foliolosa]|uniref:Uncharacterized protein n=1 Tax=Castilleja foliolosa TaxID=1961234 RepID=A0ABD3D338_9LAMI
MAFQTGGMIGRVVDVERIEVPAAETTLTVAVGAEFLHHQLQKLSVGLSRRLSPPFSSGCGYSSPPAKLLFLAHGIEPYSVEISTNEEIFILDSVNGHIHKISSPLTRFVTRDDKVRVPCEKVAEEGGFGGYLQRGIAVAFSRGGSGGCAWPDAADLEEATGLRRGSGRLRTVIEAHDRQHGGAAKMVDRWGEPDSSRCVLAVSMLGRESDPVYYKRQA